MQKPLWLVIFAAAFAGCSQQSEAPPRPALLKPALEPAEIERRMASAGEFAAALNSGQTGEQLARFMDAAGFERLVLEGLLVKTPDMLDRGKFLDEVRKHPQGEAAEAFQTAMKKSGFPVPGFDVAVTGMSPQGRPILRWTDDSGMLSYGELVPAEVTAGQADNVRFVDLIHWNWESTASGQARAVCILLSPAHQSALHDSWEGDASLDQDACWLLVPRPYFVSAQHIPSNWDSIPASLRNCDALVLNLAYGAIFNEATYMDVPRIMGEAKDKWQNEHPDSPALLLRKLRMTSAARDLSEWKDLEKRLEARGTRDAKLQEVICGALWCLGKFPAARSKLDEARRIFPKNGPLMWLDFHLAVDEVRYARAAEIWQEMLGISPLMKFRNLPENPSFHAFLQSAPGRSLGFDCSSSELSPELGAEIRKSLTRTAAFTDPGNVDEFTPEFALEEAFLRVIPEEAVFDLPTPITDQSSLSTFKEYLTGMTTAMTGALLHPESNSRITFRREMGHVRMMAVLPKPWPSFQVFGEYFSVVDMVFTPSRPWRCVAGDFVESGVPMSSIAQMQGVYVPSLLLRQMLNIDQGYSREAAPPNNAVRFRSNPWLWTYDAPNMTWARWQSPGREALATTPPGLCNRFDAASAAKEASEDDYKILRNEVVSLIGETPWVRGRDVIRAATMSRHDEVIILGDKLYREGLLSAPAAWHLFLTAIEREGWALAVHALEARRLYDLNWENKSLRRLLEGIADKTVWAAFQKSTEGARWFAAFQKDSQDSATPRAPVPHGIGDNYPRTRPSKPPGFLSTEGPGNYLNGLFDSWNAPPRPPASGSDSRSASPLPGNGFR